MAETSDQDLWPPAKISTRLPSSNGRSGGIAASHRRLLARDDRFRPLRQHGVAEHRSEAAQRGRRRGDAVEPAFEERGCEAFPQRVRHPDHRLGADHHVGFRAVHGLHLAKPRIAGEAAQDAQAEFIEQRRHAPELAADVPFADQVHVVRGDAGAVAPAAPDRARACR